VRLHALRAPSISLAHTLFFSSFALRSLQGAMLRPPVIVPAVNPSTGRPNAEHGYTPRAAAVVLLPPRPAATHVIGVPVAAAVPTSCVATVQPLSPPPTAAAPPGTASGARRKEE
jgi:hypothetical protein